MTPTKRSRNQSDPSLANSPPRHDLAAGSLPPPPAHVEPPTHVEHPHAYVQPPYLRPLDVEHFQGLIRDAGGAPFHPDDPADVLGAHCVDHGFITEAQFEHESKRPKRLDPPKRPDRAAHLREQHETKESVLQCTLASLTRGIENRTQLLANCNELVKRVSLLVDRAWITNWLHVARVLALGNEDQVKHLGERVVKWEHYYEMLTHDLKGYHHHSQQHDEQLETTLRTYRSVLDNVAPVPTEIQSGFPHVLQSVAQQMQRNFLMHFTWAGGIIKRLRRFIRLRLNGVTPHGQNQLLQHSILERSRTLAAVIYGTDDKFALLHPSAANLAREIRHALGLVAGTRLSDEALNANIISSIRFMQKMITFFKEEERKVKDGFYGEDAKEHKGVRSMLWMPLGRDRALHLTFTPETLFELLVRSGSVAPVRGADLRLDMIREVFGTNIKKHVGAKGESFTGTITTNGTSVSIHCRKPKSDNEKKLGKMHHKYHDECDAAKEHGAKSPPKSAELVELEKKVKEETTMPQDEIVKRPVHLACDPGIKNVMFFRVWFLGKQLFTEAGSGEKKRRVPVSFRYTGRQHRVQSGRMRGEQSIRIKRRSNPRLAAFDRDAKNYTKKTVDATELLEYYTFRAQSRVDHIAWEHSKGHKNTVKSIRFRMASGARRSVDRFFVDMKEKLVKIISPLVFRLLFEDENAQDEESGEEVNQDASNAHASDAAALQRISSRGACVMGEEEEEEPGDEVNQDASSARESDAAVRERISSRDACVMGEEEEEEPGDEVNQDASSARKSDEAALRLKALWRLNKLRFLAKKTATLMVSKASVAWGSARLHPGIKGNLGAPTTECFHRASTIHFPRQVVLTNEDCSTKMCSDVGCPAVMNALLAEKWRVRRVLVPKEDDFNYNFRHRLLHGVRFKRLARREQKGNPHPTFAREVTRYRSVFVHLPKETPEQCKARWKKTMLDEKQREARAWIKGLEWWGNENEDSPWSDGWAETMKSGERGGAVVEGHVEQHEVVDQEEIDETPDDALHHAEPTQAHPAHAHDVRDELIEELDWKPIVVNRFYPRGLRVCNHSKQLRDRDSNGACGIGEICLGEARGGKDPKYRRQRHAAPPNTQATL